MKKLYFLDEEEKNRILNIHESATKRQYLSEQQTGAKFIYNNPNDKAYDYKMENGKYYFKGKEGTTDKKAQKYKDWYEAKADEGIKAIKALFDAGTNVTTTEIKPATNTDPSKVATETQNLTKQIQALLKLDQTGNMDSSLLQKINDILNGKPQETPKVDTNTQTPPKVEPLQTSLKSGGVVQQQLNTMSPEQLTAGLQQKAAAATAGLK